MSKPFRGVINVDIRESEPDWTPFEAPRAPDGAPSVLYIVLDDVGFSAMEPFGGLIETPNINRIAAQGYLLPDDATALIAQAQASDVLAATTNTSLPAFGEINIGTGTDGSDPGAGLDDLRVRAGDTLQLGYAVSLPGKHAAANITLSRPQVVVTASCDNSGRGSHIHQNCLVH